MLKAALVYYTEHVLLLTSQCPVWPVTDHIEVVLLQHGILDNVYFLFLSW